MGRLFWLAAALCMATICHSAFMLMVPAYSLDRSISRFVAADGANRFIILDHADQQRLFPAYPPGSVVGVCAFDVSSSDVQLDASLPQGFWTLTIYSGRGGVIYAANSQQTGSHAFSISLSLAPSFIDMIKQSAEKEAIGEDTGWTVESPTEKGLAVMWYPVTEPAARAGIVRHMAGSGCHVRA